MPVSFDIDPSKTPSKDNYYQVSSTTIREYFEKSVKDLNGRLVTGSNSSANYVATSQSNGFVSACVLAYNSHYELALSPDHVWVAITTSLSRYINAKGNAEKLRHLFVSHEGQIKLEAYGSGGLYSGNYPDLIRQLSEQIGQNTKGKIREVMECNFSTTTPTSKVVSQVALMGAMQEYFRYYCHFECGLPKVTLLGTLEDWESVIERVKYIGSIEDPTLRAWAEVLGFVLEHFVQAFHGRVDKDFWNRIVNYKGGGSGPTYITGWVLAFVGFDHEGEPILENLKSIRATNKYGRMEIGVVPPATVSVPVTVDDYDTLFYAGAMLAELEGNTVSPTLDWAIIDITKQHE